MTSKDADMPDAAASTPHSSSIETPNDAKETAHVSSSSSSSSSSSDDDDSESMTSSSSVSDDEGEEKNDTTTEQLSSSSKLFIPHRSLGFVTPGHGFDLYSHIQSETYITIPIGDRFQVMKCDHLTPVLISTPLPHRTHQIRHIASDKKMHLTLCFHGGANSGITNHCTLYRRIHVASTNPTLRLPGDVTAVSNLGRVKLPSGAWVLATAVISSGSGSGRGSSVPVVGGEDSSSEEEDDDEGGGSAEGYLHIVSGNHSRGIQKSAALALPFHPLSLCHPPTYMNKILIGGSDSHLHLVNFHTRRVIHRFTCLPPSTSLTELQPSPALDVIAAGSHNGVVYLLNVKLDAVLFTLTPKSPTAVTSLSFRTDAGAAAAGLAPLAVSDSTGTVTVWNMQPDEETNQRSILTRLEQWHPGGIARAVFLPGEPVLVSSGTDDNCVKMTIFDSPDHKGRVLRQRVGHARPPRLIRHVRPAVGSVTVGDVPTAPTSVILSAGGDGALRSFSTVRTVADKELSQGAGLHKKSQRWGVDVEELKLPPVVALAVCDVRGREWGDLVTIHRGLAEGYVWSVQSSGAQDGPVLRQDHWPIGKMSAKSVGREDHASSVIFSSCGNFAIVGTRGGVIYKYNVQSGLPRGQYPMKEGGGADEKGVVLPGSVAKTVDILMGDGKKKGPDKSGRPRGKKLVGHTADVVGLAVDSLNSTLLSASQDATLLHWSFQTHTLLSSRTLPAPASHMTHLRDVDLAAIALDGEDDKRVLLYDATAQAFVRQFRGHTGSITDLGFGVDGRLLFSSSLDKSLRVWDIPTGKCVDWMEFQNAVTSLTVGPTGDYLATSHAGMVGISLWLNKSFYQEVVLEGGEVTEPCFLETPGIIAEGASKNQYNDEDESDNHDSTHSSNKNASQSLTSPDANPSNTYPTAPKKEGLITMSGLPPIYWKNLFHLDIVKERNKPRDNKPEKPASAPFFLQWRPGESITGFDEEEDDDKKNTEGKEEDEEWAAAWSDDDADGANTNTTPPLQNPASATPKTQKGDSSTKTTSKKTKNTVTHRRSHLATLLSSYPHAPGTPGAITNYLSSKGPSGVDVELSSLCHGSHDSEEGIPLLIAAANWLRDELVSRRNYELMNAYLCRFLAIYDGIVVEACAVKEEEEDDGMMGRREEQWNELVRVLDELKVEQKKGCEILKGKMQYTLCLLRHFSRMV